jgi:two-component system, sensor histidine kinase and response regulator
MDVDMPGMGGLEAVRAVQAIPGLESLPVISMTAHASPEDKRRCLDAGMVDHVMKPFYAPDLYKTVAKWACAGRKTDAPSPIDRASDERTPCQDSAERILQVSSILQFARSESANLEEIENALRLGDSPSAMRIAEALRSTALELGAFSVQEHGRALVEALRDKMDPFLPLRRLRKALRQLVNSTSERQEMTMPIPNTPFHATLLPDQLAKFSHQLREGDAEAVETFDILASSLSGHLGVPQTIELGRRIGLFDFDAALAILERHPLESDSEAS